MADFAAVDSLAWSGANMQISQPICADKRLGYCSNAPPDRPMRVVGSCCIRTWPTRPRLTFAGPVRR